MSVVQNLKLVKGSFDLEIGYVEWPDAGITLLTGPSGSGKSTFFRALLGLETSPKMQWIHDGVDINQLPVQKRNLGVVFQNYELFPHLTALENIELVARAKDMKKDIISRRLADLDETLDLHFLRQSVGQLSGGEKQRTALARALIFRPRYLLLDEPLAALDRDLQAEGRDLILKLSEKEKVPILMISHDHLDEAILASHVLRMRHGRLVRD